ncbi:hypothetical protein L3Y34_010837 [Caenorhabditis briggsae]|uniref:Uncharacterized protein n=1 Tax=Caenorhabditis briggsae TaxID=6238 RepID=A0AAE8ZSR2_CAEBR|nr:hypothetical protein L3Y34_010837 [Caenorhabditis briggsae]
MVEKDIGNEKEPDRKDENPNVWFEDDIIWIAELYAQIQKQRSCRVNYIALFQMPETAVPGIDPLSSMNYRLTENY